MKILFIGQRGIPTFSREALRERRVEALATSLAETGHEVVVTCARPFISRSIKRFNGVELKHLFSLNSEKPGGWIHAFLELMSVWRRKSDAVHMHGWQLAVLSPMAVLLNPEASFIWTVDVLPDQPRWLLRLVVRWAVASCDVVTVPTRQLQYRLLQELGVRSYYVPDGYQMYSLPNLPLSRLGMRKGQYCVTIAMKPREVRFIARAYAKAKTRKKLVVLQRRKGYFKRLAREFSFLYFVGDPGRREMASLLSQAAMVIAAGHETALETLLYVMDSGKAVVATAQPQFEETLGVSAQFVREGDEEGLTQALRSVVNNKKQQAVWGAKARRRARRHFKWSRIVSEYLELYHSPVALPVPVDSARPSFAQVKAAQ